MNKKGIHSARSRLTTRLEVEQLAQLFPGRAEILLGAAATRPALERLAGFSDILHLATHASLDRQADLAHLALADGAYSARQVFACPIKPGALVVLSACNTANSRAQERAPTTLANAFACRNILSGARLP